MVESRGLFFESLRVGNRLLVVFVRACLFTVSCLEKCIVWGYMTLLYYVFSFFFYKNFQFCMHMLVLYSVKAEIAFLRYDCSRSHVWRNVQCNAIHRLLLCFSFVFLFSFVYTRQCSVFIGKCSNVSVRFYKKFQISQFVYFYARLYQKK